MDNITHSLIGVAFGEAFFQGAKKNKIVTENARPLFYLVSILANNFPDLDLLYYFLDPTSLGYLLHHRGHTHTFIWLWPQLLILMFFVWIGFKAFKKPIQKTKFLWLGATAITGLHTHIVMDFFNVYGVHPLHPFNNEWFYGDSVFIIEPLFWTCLMPLLLICAKSFWKYLVLVPCAALIMLGGYAQILNSMSAILIVSLSIVMTVILLKSSDVMRPFYSLLSLTLVIMTFSTFSKITKSAIYEEVSDQKMSNLFDIILSPAPANPFCWSLLFIDGDNSNYRTQKGVYNFLPKFEACPEFLLKSPTEMAGTENVFNNSANISWNGMYQTTYTELFGQTVTDCRLRAWLQFVRAPLKDGELYKDARFLQGDEGFANLKEKSPDEEKCPPYPVPWNSPFKYEKFLKPAP